MAKRGRPAGTLTVNAPLVELPTKFKREFKDKKTGITSVWTYDLSKTTRGPISTEEIYPKDYVSGVELNEALPKSQRQYLNPANGKMVGYTRAYNLGLV